MVAFYFAIIKKNVNKGNRRHKELPAGNWKGLFFVL